MITRTRKSLSTSTYDLLNRSACLQQGVGDVSHCTRRSNIVDAQNVCAGEHGSYISCTGGVSAILLTGLRAMCG